MNWFKKAENDVICEGIGNDFWPMDKDVLNENYTKTGNLRDKIGGKIYTPKKNKTVKARKLKEKTVIKTKDGRKLNGKAGDYEVKRNEEDRWIVDNDIFKKTYKEKEK